MERHTHHLAQVVTLATFRRPEHPVRCSMDRYHVFTWECTLTDCTDARPPVGTRCQCGLLEERDRT